MLTQKFKGSQNEIRWNGAKPLIARFILWVNYSVSLKVTWVCYGWCKLHISKVNGLWIDY